MTIGEGDEVPFFLALPANCNAQTATLANGAERIAVPCRRVGTQLLLDFPVYGTRIAAEATPGGGLTGFWDHATDAGRAQVPFRSEPIARLDERDRFGSGAPAARDLAGTWRMTFTTHGAAKGVFEQESSGVIRGTIDVPADYGDLRFLAGEVEAGTLSLSTFDGGAASLLRGRVSDRGHVEGEFIKSYGLRERFTAEPSPEFEIVDPLQQIRVTSATRRLDFAPLLTERYRDKAIVIEIFGTWCATCNDLAPLLSELYRQHKDEGLEIVGIAYEFSHDEANSRERLAAYRTRHRVEWDVVTADEDPAMLLGGPATLSPIEGVPVTIFLNRDRTIRAVYTGFRGPAMGAAHEQTVATFRRLTREIVASPVSPPLDR